MAIFRAIPANNEKEDWLVERSELDGTKTVVGPLYCTAEEAIQETDRLNRELELKAKSQSE